MKKLLLILPLLFVGCSYVRWVTTDKNGQIINDDKRPVNIIGNPEMACYDSKNQLITRGYFVRQTEEGSFLIDEFGKRYVLVENPNCRLGRD
jgi:hypothetical protein